MLHIIHFFPTTIEKSIFSMFVLYWRYRDYLSVKRKTRVSKGLITFARNSLLEPRILIRDYRDNLNNPIISKFSHRVSVIQLHSESAMIVIAAQPDQYLYTFTSRIGITLHKRGVLSSLTVRSDRWRKSVSTFWD